jgi:nucleotide-binding universal stress UspA family protein
MGTRGFGGLRRALLGNVADSVVRHAHCPVLVVRPTRGVSSPF